jgi:UMF1 family MFS transporter
MNAGVNDRREVFGWVMYDWANSGFQTTVITVLLGPYLTALAQHAVGENGRVLSLGPLGDVTAKSLFPYCVSLSVFLQVFLLPVLGAIADYTSVKKRLMATLTYVGVGATCVMSLVGGGSYLAVGLLFVVANLCYGASLVLYNAFLNDITTADRRDEVSSRGYALGYLGGGVLLALNLGLVLKADSIGVSRDLAVRISLLSAGLWWGGFAAITFARLRPRPAPMGAPAPGRSRAAAGLSQVAATIRELRRLPQTFRYLLAYMLYNDGIQTVISTASVFLAQELFVARGVPADESFLIGLVLMIQFIAFFGALLFERIARIVQTKNAILISLVLWTGVIVYSYRFLQTTTQAWVMGGVIAIVLGGSQALSRSLFSLMIPPGREASFFGLYEISERGTSWIGPLIFGMVAGATNSYRQAILSLVVLLLGGMLLLALTDTDRAVREARPA